MGTLSKVRDNSQKIIWAFLITFILSMVAGGLMGGFNLVGQFKEWIGFNTSDQHAFSIADERISHQAYASTYEQAPSFTSDDGVKFLSHISALESFKQRHVINKLYEDIFKSDQVEDVDILTNTTSSALISSDLSMDKVPLRGFSEEFTDTNSNGIWDDEETYIDVNGKWDEGEDFKDLDENGKWDEGEEFTDKGNGKYDQGETIIDANENGKWDKAEPFVDTKNGEYDNGEEFKDLDENGKWDEGEEFTDALNGTWDSNTEKWISSCIREGKIDLSVVEDTYLRQLMKSSLNPSSESHKRQKLNSINSALNYITNDEIDFDDKVSNTQITANYLKYDLSEIDEKDIKIDEQKLRSSIAPYEKHSSGVSITTLAIISLLLLIYSYINRESRAKLSFGGFFFIILFITTIFKFVDYNKQGTDKIRTISYIYLSKQDSKKDTDGNGKWDEGEKFTDLNGNKKWDKDEDWTDSAPNENFTKTKDEIVKGITKDGFNMKYLEDNDLKDNLFKDHNLVKNFIVEEGVNTLDPSNGTILLRSNLLSEVISKAFEAEVGEHFIVEDKSDGEVQNIIIAYIKEEGDYYEHKEYQKLKNEYIKEEKEKKAKEDLQNILQEIATEAQNIEDAIQLEQFFEELSIDNESFTSGKAVGSLSDAVAPNNTNKPLVTPIPGLTAQNNASILGTLYEMNKNETSDVVFSTDGAYAFVLFMNEKNHIQNDDIDYKKQKEQKVATLNRRGVASTEYYRDITENLSIEDWRNESSITITVDPDSRATKNLTNLYFDFNSYLQLRNALISR